MGSGAKGEDDGLTKILSRSSNPPATVRLGTTRVVKFSASGEGDDSGFEIASCYAGVADTEMATILSYDGGVGGRSVSGGRIKGGLS